MESKLDKQVPRFAVVGRVNKGKSSIVSTFTEDDAVRVSRTPGTTVNCQQFEIRAGDKTLCYIFDTPGFEDADGALAWLEEHESTAAERARVVSRFVDTFEGQDRFTEECELLGPILAGAGILYVVDASRPYRSNYENEMEILRWTGQPRMALINRVGEGDYSDDWRRALDQYFSIVRIFDAHRSGFADRLGLLRAFRELREEGRDRIDEAISVLEREWSDRRLRAAKQMTALLVDALTYREEWNLDEGEDPEERRDEMIARLRKSLVDREREQRKAIESIYRHERLQREESSLEASLIDSELFAEQSWRLLGLNTWQLVRAGVVGGAAVGGTLDVAVGGSSFLAGTLIGGVVGGVSSYFGGRRAADFEVLGQSLGGQVAYVGPIGDKNFAWVLLDRALLHFDRVVGRPHAKRSVMVLDHLATDSDDGERRVDSPDKQGLSHKMAASRQSKLGRLFSKLARRGDTVPDELRRELTSTIQDVLVEIEEA